MGCSFAFPLDKEITQGDDRKIKMIFDTDEVKDWDFFYTAKKNSSTLDDAASITVDPEEVIFSESSPDYTNIVEIPLSHDVTNIEPGKYLHDIQIVKPDGQVQTIARGILTVLGHQTRRTT